ncbi:MAG: SGNH/GDSL hydrolase family protein [Candidatus Thiodiazotropha sp. (ex Epidulcina cf. delphinae)]|nr:SGNH/GDSL hydrolase family protein [Candidatus Thiodiazotropha sp. (ex Epidulcina cf. delphinae)]
MQEKQQKSWLLTILAILFLTPCLSFADKPFERIVVFGDSLSDPGNAFFLTGRKLKPPYSTLDAFLIPDGPYARGGKHFSNGATWVEQLAKPLDLGDTVGPAFKGENEDKLKKSNYAVGGARAHDNGIDINLTAQAGAFFTDAQGVAPGDALYVIALGGNDVRDAVAALAVDGSGAASVDILTAALTAISDNILALYDSGARTFLVGNSPDLSLTPAIRTLDLVSPGAAMAAALFSAQFNAELDTLLDTLGALLPEIQIARLDLYQSLHDLVANPANYGLKNVLDACVMPDEPPFACKKAKRYLFWDGIHPTKTTHRILAEKAHQALTSIIPEQQDGSEEVFDDTR